MVAWKAFGKTAAIAVVGAMAACSQDEGAEVGPGFREAERLGFMFAYEVIGRAEGQAAGKPFSFPVIAAGAAAVRKAPPPGELHFVAAPAARSGEAEGEPDPDNNMAFVLKAGVPDEICRLTGGARVVYRTGGVVYAGENLDITVADCTVDDRFANLQATVTGRLFPQNAGGRPVEFNARVDVKTLTPNA